MTPQEYKTALLRLGLTQKAAADLLGVSLRTSASFANGHHPIPHAVAMFLSSIRLIRVGRRHRTALLRKYLLLPDDTEGRALNHSDR